MGEAWAADSRYLNTEHQVPVQPPGLICVTQVNALFLLSKCFSLFICAFVINEINGRGQTRNQTTSQGPFGWDVASQGHSALWPCPSRQRVLSRHGMSPPPAELPALNALLKFLTFDFIFFFQLATPRGLWDLSSLMSRDRTLAPSSGRVES